MTSGYLRAEEWESWSRIALLSFLLRVPAQLEKFPKVSPEAKSERDRFLRYGWELEATERDLSECVNELCLAETLHQGSLTLKKFAVVYHTDNFNVRVHKMRENALMVVALAVGLQPERRRAGDSLLNEIRRGLAKRRIKGFLEAVAEFETERLIKDAIDARHAFVHRYRDEPARGVGARERYAWVPEPRDDPLAEAVRVLNKKSVDLYIERQAARLTAVMEPIRRLRRRLFGAALQEVLQVAQSRLTPARFEVLKPSIDPFTDLV